MVYDRLCPLAGTGTNVRSCVEVIFKVVLKVQAQTSWSLGAVLTTGGPFCLFLPLLVRMWVRIVVVRVFMCVYVMIWWPVQQCNLILLTQGPALLLHTRISEGVWDYVPNLTVFLHLDCLLSRLMIVLPVSRHGFTFFSLCMGLLYFYPYITFLCCFFFFR